MPELPEVETVCRGISPHIINQTIKGVIVRNDKLRYPVTKNLANIIHDQTVINISRRAKYILIETTIGSLIIHLGMSGSLLIINDNAPPQKHDHVDIIFENCTLRYHDPRRFGCILFEENNPLQHKLLCKLGPEPLTDSFSGKYLFDISRKRKKPIKLFLMDNHIVVGAGNIYANEALFISGIHPETPATSLTLDQYTRIVATIKIVLSQAIEAGGTTIQDYVNSEGKPGYFQQKLHVYGRNGMKCHNCSDTIISIKQGQRTTFLCPTCQC